MKTIHEAKAKVQLDALDALLTSNGGLIAMATGSGKSKVAIDFLNCKTLQFGRKPKTLLVVPTEKLRDINWETEFADWEQSAMYEELDRFCYASINKLRGKHYDIAIFDEIQNITPNNAEFFKYNKVDTLVCLSATPPTEFEKREILRSLKIETVYHLPLDEAVQLGIVSPYNLTFVEFNLNTDDKYIQAGSKAKYWMTTEKKQYDYLTSSINRAMHSDNRYESIKFMRLKRMRFVYNLKSRKRVAQYVLDKIIPQDQRTLIFAGSIKMAESLEENTFHSKSNDIAFDKFMNEEIFRLSAVNSLNEGMNIPNLDNALIVQVNSKERHLIQKIGRIVRFREGHIANIYIMYAKGTVDEEWIVNATKNIDKSNVKLLKFKV